MRNNWTDNPWNISYWKENFWTTNPWAPQEVGSGDVIEDEALESITDETGEEIQE
jgi:hypothetical protein